MNLFPLENLVYNTGLDPENAKKKLQQQLEPQKFIRWGFRKKNSKPYEGQIIGNTFEIRRILNYRNSFLPKIKGKIHKTTSGSRITVKMRPHTFVYVFMGIWMGGVATFFVAMLLVSLVEKEANPGLLVALVMLVFGYLMPTLSFKYESKKSTKDLEQIFVGRISTL